MSDPFPLKGRTIMRISVLVSLLMHAVLILTFRDAFSSYRTQEHMREYRVELFRPPVETMEPGQKPDAEIEKTLQEKKSFSPEKSQDTISLDTADKRYVNYARAIKERINAQWQYPRAARENLIEGTLLVIFSLSKQGHTIQIQVAESSGYDILDREATRAIRSAAPFPPFPAHITVGRLNVKASFDYRIKTKE